MRRNFNSGYISAQDKRVSKSGCYGLQKHILERRRGNFYGPKIAAASSHEVTRQDDLLAWWKFNETSGTEAADEIGDNAHPGTLEGPPAWVAGKATAFGNCLEYDGVDDYVTMANSDGIAGGTNFSVSYWLRFSDPDDGGTVMCKGQSNFWFNVTPYSWDTMRVYQYAHASGWKQANLTLPLPDTWYHCVLTIDTSSGDILSYRDAVLQDSDTIGTLTAANADDWVIGSGSGNAPGGGTDPVNPMPCLIDDIRFYGVTLSPSDIIAIYGGGNGDFE